MGLRVWIAGHGLSVDLADDWVVSEGWSDPKIQRGHGVYLQHRDGLQMNFRDYDYPTLHSVDGVRAWLSEQNWASAPFDEVVSVGEVTIVSALFEMHPAGHVVLEGFAIAGQRVANFAMPGPREAVFGARTAAETVACSVRFEGPGTP